ncbi:MAG: RDD family protein [bacterium]
MNSHLLSTALPNASMIRRLAAMVYDFFLIIALWLFTGSVLLAVFGTSTPTDGQLPEEPALGAIWVQLICYLEMFCFNFYFWRFKGQTLGMQVWKIRVMNEEGGTISVWQACVRFVIATISIPLLGIGLWWSLFSADRLTLYDQFSRTRTVYLGTKPYESEQVTDKQV